MSSTCFYFIFLFLLLRPLHAPAPATPLFEAQAARCAADPRVIYVKRYSRNLVFKRPFFIFKPYLNKNKNTRAAYSCSHVRFPRAALVYTFIPRPPRSITCARDAPTAAVLSFSHFFPILFFFFFNLCP